MGDEIERVRKPSLNITTEAEFEALMKDVDGEMIATEVKITARPFMAGLIITRRFDVVLNACPPDRDPIAGSFEPLELSIRIHQWIERRYGDKRSVVFRIGAVAMPLRGDLYVINCPRVYGNVKFVFDPATAGEKRNPIGVTEPPTCNIVDLIEGCTPDLALSLTAEEVTKCTISFYTGLAAYSAMDAIKDQALIPEALANCENAVSNLIPPRAHPGLSQWESLQAVEKLIKAFITAKGQRSDPVHALSKLYDSAAVWGLPTPPPSFIADVQCSPGVRYGQPAVALDKAVLAHLLSLQMCEVAAREIAKAIARPIPTVAEPILDGMPLSEFIQKYSRKPN